MIKFLFSKPEPEEIRIPFVSIPESLETMRNKLESKRLKQQILIEKHNRKKETEFEPLHKLLREFQSIYRGSVAGKSPCYSYGHAEFKISFGSKLEYTFSKGMLFDVYEYTYSSRGGVCRLRLNQHCYAETAEEIMQNFIEMLVQVEDK